MLRLNPRAALAFAHDIVAALIAWSGAFWLRFNLEIPQPYLAGMLETLLWVTPLQSIVFWRFGLYRGIWRYASLPDLKRILLAVGITALAIPAVVVMLQLPVPRSVLVLDPLLLAMIMSGSRVAYRMWKERTLRSITDGEREAVIVSLSTGQMYRLLLHPIRCHPHRPCRQRSLAEHLHAPGQRGNHQSVPRRDDLVVALRPGPPRTHLAQVRECSRQTFVGISGHQPA